MTDGHPERHEDLAAYALGALPPADVAELESHLAGCKSCAGQLRWLQRAADLLPAAVEQLEPPKRLRKSLLAAVREDERRGDARRRAERRSRPRDWFGPIAAHPAMAGAACALLIAAAIAGYQFGAGDRGGDSTQLIAAIPAKGAPPGTKVATLERDGDRATLHVQRLPRLPAGSVYQAWVLRNGTMEPSTPFVVRRDGSGEVAVDRSLAGADAVAVTREPRGGSETPSGAPLLQASLN